MKAFLKLIVLIGICEFVGLASTPFTIASIPTWYAHLHKPFFSPPNWVFGPVWTTLYLLMGVAAFLILQKGLKKKGVKRALTYFMMQLFFNFLWSVLFFGLHSPLLGLLDIFVLVAFVVITIYMFYKLSKQAAYLLIPYLLWICFATVLNFSVVLLNP